MSVKNWLKWSFLVAGSTLAGGGIGACVADFLLENFILRVVN